MNQKFEEYCKKALYPLIFHLLDHFLQVVERFGSLEMICGSQFERVNMHIKRI